MIDEQALRQGLQKLLKDTDAAIRERLADEPPLEAELRERHAAAVRAERTEGSAKGYNAFKDESITQAAVHWLLGCVFVRFLEDNGWLDERNAKVAWIAGAGERLSVAKGRRTLFLRPNADLTDRDYLLHVFAEAAKMPGVAGLFDPKHNPLYLLQPTGQGAAKIVEFFQRVDPDSNRLIHDFTDPAHGTRFLGDLYQNLSESARKRYALCQTPGFVIDFILDRTLTPALDAFGLETVRMIDPSCGSGHFLLEGFARLFRMWQGKEPGTNPPALAQRALDAVYGVDLNPFAVEITRFRLLIAALTASGIERLSDAPDFRFNVAAGDSLLHGSRVGGGGIARELFEDRLQHFYDTEDAEALKHILGQPYHVVVGNPPYINVSDSVLREAYRARFLTCHGKYQLGVPFTERFFDLTARADAPTEFAAGWMGMIVSNAFMKRSFGKKLIEEYLCKRDITHVIDSSWVYLPGHGTPTAIIIGRHRPPLSSTIRAVRGIKGDVGIPVDPARASVWLEIIDNIDNPGFEGSRVSVADALRESLAQHPWAFGGGGATELKETLDQLACKPLGDLTESIGYMAITGEDDAFLVPEGIAKHKGLNYRRFCEGQDIQDWTIRSKGVSISPQPSLWFWPFRTTLKNRRMFGKRPEQMGKDWFAYMFVAVARYEMKTGIAFSDISTHNTFVFTDQQYFLNRHAPVVKPAQDASVDSIGEYLAILNSSTACFWLKQVCFPKGGDHVGSEGARVRKLIWDVYYEFDGTNLKNLPVPGDLPQVWPALLLRESVERSQLLTNVVNSERLLTRDDLRSADRDSRAKLGMMVAFQEELDWQCYRLYEILGEDVTLPPDQVPPLQLGERAFEIVLARAGEEPLWFERHKSTPITDPPAHWPEAYRKLVERRIEIIETNRDVALIERPEYKRRWNLPTWEEMESAALNSWLLDRIEANELWKEHRLYSCAQLRDALSRDLEWMSVAEMYHAGPLEDLDRFVIDLATQEAVPFLPVLRYTEIGLRKRAEWEQVWSLQREEDAGAKVEIPVPPKYISKDFQRSDYWRLRGGLDVPKERFILYPGLQRDSDETPVLGWAGWSHLEQARALASYYQRMRNEEGWEAERLKPILAGLLDLRAWLKQWHDEVPDPETGLKLGSYFSDYAEAQCGELGFSIPEVLAWKPAQGTALGRGQKSTGRKSKAK